jgi:hypothetical protein
VQGPEVSELLFRFEMAATIMERLAAIELSFDERGVDEELRKELHEVVLMIRLKYTDTDELSCMRELYVENEDDDKIFYQLLYTAQKTVE